MRSALPVFLVVALAAALGCDGDSPTSPTTTPTEPVAEPAFTEEFISTVPVGGARFYSFTTTQNGTINLTLTAIAGQFVPSTVQVSLGLGQPSGTECVTTTTQTTAAGTSPQITGTYAPGVYCARVADIGNLFAPATFTVVIAFP